MPGHNVDTSFAHATCLTLVTGDPICERRHPMPSATREPASVLASAQPSARRRRRTHDHGCAQLSMPTSTGLRGAVRYPMAGVCLLFMCCSPNL